MTPFQKESREEFEEKVKKLNSRDWNKDWPTAQREAPSKCSSCGRHLEKPKFKGEILINKCNIFPCGLISHTSGEIRIDCKCGVCYIWSFPNVWKRTHRYVEFMMFMEDSGKLLKPMKVTL